MTTQLFIVRHGHAPFHGDDDFQRPLSELGLKQAQSSGQFISQHLTQEPVTIIASAAKRTTLTAQQIASVLPSKPKLILLPELYGATVGDWCQQVSLSHAQQLILVGHNPTVSQLSRYLSQDNSASFSPATTAHFDLELTSEGLTIPASLKHIFRPE